MRPGRVAVALEIAAFAHYCLFSHAPGIFQIIFSFLCHWILSVGYWIFVVFVNFFVHRQKIVDVSILRTYTPTFAAQSLNTSSNSLTFSGFDSAKLLISVLSSSIS